jgi:hypothetical protein
MLLGSILFYLKKKLKNTVHGSQWLRSNADDEDSKVSNLVSLLRFDKLFEVRYHTFISKVQPSTKI